MLHCARHLAAVVLACASAACTGAEQPPPAAPPVTVPEQATPVTTVERDGARFELLSHDRCTYLVTTNLADEVVREQQLCGLHSFTTSDACLREADVDAGAGDDESTGPPPCASEVAHQALWGRNDHDFIGYACTRDLVAPVGPRGEHLLVAPRWTGPTEPGFLLPDGRAVQGPAWGVPLDEADVRRCRAAAGLEPEPVGPPTGVQLRGLDLPRDLTVEVSTDTGYLSLSGVEVIVDDPSPADRVVLFPDTTTLRVRTYGDLSQPPTREWVVPVTDEVRSALFDRICAAVSVRLDEDGRTGRLEPSC